MEIITRKEALEKGLTRYYTGKPCKYGHDAERMRSNGRCVMCLKEISKKWVAENKDKVASYAKAKYLKDKEKINAKNRERWAKNREKYNATHRLWAEKNKEYKKQLDKEYAANNRKRKNANSRAYYQRNKVECAERCARRNRIAKAATPIWANFDSILAKYKERETMSKVTGIVHHVDHIIPLQGKTVCGLHVHNNLRVIPARDNMTKSNKFELQ